MSTGRGIIDGLLVQWGDRLFYPANRTVRPRPQARLDGTLAHRAADIRQRIAATVVRRAPQVFTRVTGGGRGMAGIAVHLRYITNDGRLEFEDDRGVTRQGKAALLDVQNQWRYSGSFIASTGHRREALNILLNMPAATDPDLLLKAARDFARIELAGHRYVMALHRHQTRPHVHLCVKVESSGGERLRPYEADLRRWRETFAERLRHWGVDAEATRRPVRGAIESYDPLWVVRAKARGQPPPRSASPATTDRLHQQRHCIEAIRCWAEIAKALNESDREEDRRLAPHVTDFVARMPFVAQTLKRHPEALPEVRRYLQAHPQRDSLRERQQEQQPTATRSRPDIQWRR
jgi:hypothetical protein